MLRRQPLYQAVEPAQISSGLVPDAHELQSPLWRVGENVSFVAGRVERLVPPAFILDVTAPGRGISQVQDASGVRWIWFANSGGGVFRWFGPGAEAIEVLMMQANQSGAKPASFVDFTHYGDWTISNSGESQARLFKPGVGSVNYATELGNVLVFMKMMSFVVAIGYDNGKRYAWSNPINIEDWAPDTEDLGGSAPIEDFNTRIRAASRLGQFISVYAEDQMALISFIGEPAVFSHRVVLDGIGAVGKAAVATDGRANYGVGRNGVWRTDGQSFQYIDTGRLRKYLQENVNWDQASKIVAARNDVTGCIEFHFPIGAGMENSEGWSFDPATGGWGKVVPMTSMVERTLFRKPLGINVANGLVLLADNPALAGPLDLQTKPFPLATPHTGVLVDEADFLLRRASNVEFRLGVSERTDAASFVDWTPWQGLNTDTRTYRLASRVAATFHKLQLRSTANNWDLDLQGFLLYGQAPHGSKRDSA